MNGREVFRHAVQKIYGVIEETLVSTGYAADEIDLYVPHQANQRILDGIADCYCEWDRELRCVAANRAAPGRHFRLSRCPAWPTASWRSRRRRSSAC